MIGVREAGAAEIRPLLARAELFDPGTGETLDAIMARGRGFVIEQGGAPVLAYVLEISHDVCFILAAGGRAGWDMTATGLEIIERQAAGLGAVAFQTKRRGLMKKATRSGYSAAGVSGCAVIMAKALKT